MNPKIRKVIQGVHMGMGHDGLAKLIATSCNVDVTKLVVGDLILCLNKHGDKMKVVGGRGLVVGYLRMPEKQRIMKEALQFLPQTFGASGFDYNAAVGKALDAKFASYKMRKTQTVATPAAPELKAVGA